MSALLSITAQAIRDARAVLDAAETTHAKAIAAAVNASVPGPWVAVPEVGAQIEQGPVTIWIRWFGGAWDAWASTSDPTVWTSGPWAASNPRAALDALWSGLHLSRSPHRVAALALVTRLLRGRPL